MVTLYQTAEPGNGWVAFAMGIAIIVSALLSGHALHAFADLFFWGETRLDRMVQALPADTGAYLGLAVGILIVLS